MTQVSKLGLQVRSYLTQNQDSKSDPSPYHHPRPARSTLNPHHLLPCLLLLCGAAYLFLRASPTCRPCSTVGAVIICSRPCAASHLRRPLFPKRASRFLASFKHLQHIFSQRHRDATCKMSSQGNGTLRKPQINAYQDPPPAPKASSGRSALGSLFSITARYDLMLTPTICPSLADAVLTASAGHS